MKNYFKCFFAGFTALIILTSCSFFSESIEPTSENYDSKISAVRFSSTVLSVTVKESEYLKVNLTPSADQGKCNVRWEFDSEYISAKTDNFGAIITGKKSGTTYIKASCNGIVATCLISVISNGSEDTDNPYIYSNYSVVQLQPGNTTTVITSLYGGSISDMEDFTWEIKDPSIASIASSRNNCVITAIKPGSTQLVCHHPNAEYDYTFVIYVYTDKLTETYITTDYNVLTVNKNDTTSKMLTVDLVNPINAAYKNGFTWNYADEQSKSIISMSANLNNAEIVPIKNGIANIVVSHENSQYDLNIIVRVSTIVKNTYIEVSSSTVVVQGSDAPYSVFASLANYDGYADPEGFVWEVPESALSLAECSHTGNTLQIKGKKNGIFKVKVSHELSEYSRNILVILQNQIGSAIDSSMYITTDQNFIQTQVGRSPTTVNVRLIGGIDGEDNIGDDTTNFSWYIKGGRNNGIVEVQQVTGIVKDVKDLNSRSAVTSGESCLAQLVINPLSKGELTIVVTHPRCLYDTEIQVKVYSESALVNPKTITTDESLIRLLNGASKEVTATLRNQAEGEENNIEWSTADSSKVFVTPSKGQTTQIKACGTGSSQTYVTAHLDGAVSDKKILVLAADTEKELADMKGIFADSTYLRIAAGETKTISVEQFGLSSSDRVSWSVDKSSLCTVNGDSSSPYCTSATVQGLAEGKAFITASVGGSAPVAFEVTVLKAGESSDIFDENAGYLTTNQNAVVLENEGDSQELSVSGVNISAKDMLLYTNWTMTDLNAVAEESVFDLYGSPGSNVRLTANKPGKSTIKVSNKFSANSININAKCGELYEWNDDYIVYITTESDVINILNGESKTIGCSLVNTTSKVQFYWSVSEGQENIEIQGLTSGTCNIKALNPGQSIITVSNSLAGEITKEILVNVANSEEELKGFKYLTTTQNVVTVGEQSNVTVTVEIKNADSNILTGYSWRSTNESVASVVGSGNIAVVYGKAIGTAKIIVENYENCSYPLEIIVNTVDPIAASQDPYITCNNIVTCTVGGDAATIAAELVGGSSSDTTGFTWSIVDTSIATLYASNDSAQIKAVKEGVTQVILSHPKASVSRSILVICEPKITTNCYISVTESIIKMSPSGDPKTITATLVNGDADDVYDFKWWADSYDKINMNYTSNQCIIEPISSGTVTVHLSHPKAANQKDIVLYISNYTDFAFAQSHIELTTGSDFFINMEVPATGVDCDVSYRSSNGSLCTAWGNNSVCTLHPGSVGEGLTSESCVIYATLQTKGGVKQAEAQLLVSVTKKDETRPYIGLSPDSTSTIITLNKDEVRNLSAVVYGNTSDTNSAGLRWTINNGNGNFIEFTGKTVENDSTTSIGRDVQIRALNSGKTTITITHADENGLPINPMTVYVIVTGVSEPSVTLNFSKLPVYIGEDTQIIQATVLNDTGEELEWKVVNNSDPETEQDYFTFTSKGNKATIFAKKPGNATVYCTIPSNKSTAKCEVEIREAEKLNFFVYDDESNYEYKDGKLIDHREKYYLTTFQLYPGETKPVHWETVPASDKVTQWYKGDSSFFDMNQTGAGYFTEWTNPQTNETYRYPEGVGTIAITGKPTEGTAVLTATSASRQSDSISVTNSYNYLFTLDKSMISTTPKQVHDNEELLYVNYELRPACSKIIVTNYDAKKSWGKNLSMKEGTYSSYNAEEGQWVIDTHTITTETNSTGIVRGTLKFIANGEVNCRIGLKAVNENLISTGVTSVTSQEFGTQSLAIKSYYPKHTFTVSIKKQVPFINHTRYPDTEKYAKYSRYDASTNTIFLGDGEYISGDVSLNTSSEPYSEVDIVSVNFEQVTSSQIEDGLSFKQYQRVAGSSPGTSVNTHPFQLHHNHEYSIYSYLPAGSSTWEHITNGMANMYNLKIEGDKYIEVRNETIKETTYVGKLVVTYVDYAGQSNKATFNIPVYVQVRNCPCADDGSYYKAYKQ